MSVWFCIPSARPKAEADQVLAKWRSSGYRIALWRDYEEAPPICDLLLVSPYPGYARAVNALAREVLTQDQACDWIVTGGDDTEPDCNLTPSQIAAECQIYFTSSFGVMQPTGDRWANGSIDRICGSPWLGREFCKRMYSGRGPLFEGYSHMFVDEELQAVATRLGVLWQRRDVIHLHRHWLRTPSMKCPPHLVPWNRPDHWSESQRLFESRRHAGFPGHEPMAMTEVA